MDCNSSAAAVKKRFAKPDRHNALLTKTADFDYKLTSIVLTIMWYSFLNIFFFVFHTVFTMFNITGWMFRKTRRLNLITLLLTAFSWFVLGIWHGWGYCFCTDWHWQVRAHMGYHDQTRSYIHFLLLKLSGIDLNEQLVENATLIVFLVSLFMSVWLNTRDARRNRRGHKTA